MQELPRPDLHRRRWVLRPNGHSHEPHSERLHIAFGAREGSTAQANWLRCKKCSVICWAGDRNDQGVCDLGGAHEGDWGHNYVIPHDIQVTRYDQARWECCGRCRAMFYDGGEGKGNCPASGPHRSIPTALHFVLATSGL